MSFVGDSSDPGDWYVGVGWYFASSGSSSEGYYY